MAKTGVEAAKRLAAFRAIDEQVMPLLKPGSVVGVGSGSTVVYAVERLVEKVTADTNLFGKVKAVPSSFQATNLIVESKGALDLTDLARSPEIDVGFDGADEVDRNLVLIKGGGGCLTQEKIVASCCKKFVIVADYRKNSSYLSDQWKKGIPIEIIPMAARPVTMAIHKQFGGDAVLRMAKAKAGPLVTDNGNFILDWMNFDKELNMDKLHQSLVSIPGVVETGIFTSGMAQTAYFGNEDGSVEFKQK